MLALSAVKPNSWTKTVKSETPPVREVQHTSGVREAIRGAIDHSSAFPNGVKRKSMQEKTNPLPTLA